MRWLPESFHETPGSWLYRHPRLSWMANRELSRQLPVLYRSFGLYCAAQGYRPRAAQAVLRSVIALYGACAGNDGIVPLRVEGETLLLDLQDPRFLRIPVEIGDVKRLLRRFLRPGDTFIDAGANHGTFSVAAARLVGREGRVISIEPHPRLANLVRRSLEASACAPFEVHAAALGEHSGHAKLYVPRATSGAASLFENLSAAFQRHVVDVPLVRLDDLLPGRELPGQVFLKVDVEGSELAFLRGAEQFLRTVAPRLMIEINPSTMRAAGTSNEAFVETLAGFGYREFVTPKEPAQARRLEEALLFPGKERDIIALPAH